MEQKIIDRLAFLIDSVYPEYAFCDVEQQQNVKPPRFFITCYRSSVTPRITHAGFFYTCNFDLLFDPGTEEPEQLCNEVGFKLLPLILKIPKEQGVLHIFFDVTTALHEELEEDPDILRLIKHTKAEVV